jgi:hypothetical protein
MAVTSLLPLWEKAAVLGGMPMLCIGYGVGTRGA